MEKRTTIRIERDPGFAARAADAVRSFALGRSKQYGFDGYVDSEGYNLGWAVKEQHERPVRFRMQANENGTIPTLVYNNLVDALKLCRETP